jgi:hypothetical protein
MPTQKFVVLVSLAALSGPPTLVSAEKKVRLQLPHRRRPQTKSERLQILDVKGNL